jgi:hypothetical protein
MYSFCPENTRENNYFTEKIIDCFVTKTIPVYWGCPNIEKYFNINGIIVVEDIHDLFNKISSFSEDDYNCKLPFIEENYFKALKYVEQDKRIENVIMDYVKERGLNERFNNRSI